MNQAQQRNYQMLFENRFLLSKGDTFQCLFEELMSKRYPGDFIACRPWGREGDRKNDGYLPSARTLFQVYAPTEIAASITVKKIKEDFAGAKEHWMEYFNRWVFVHNTHRGRLPPEVIKALLDIQHQNPTITVENWGYQELRNEFDRLDLSALEPWLGTVPASEVVQPVPGVEIPTESLMFLRHNAPITRPTEEGFIGRESLIASLLEHFTTGHDTDFSAVGVLVLTGIPGVGKTTAACELAYRIGGQFPGGIYWLGARATATLSTDAKAVWKQQKTGTPLPSDKQENEVFDDVRRYCENQTCLIIFDALDSEEVVAAVMQLMPRTGLSRVIITTRTEKLDLPIRSKPFQLPELDLASATEVLMSKRGFQKGDSQQTVNEICRELGFLPLALQLAARYLNKGSLQLSDYLVRLREQGIAWKGLASKIHTIPSMVTVLNQCLEDIESHGEIGELAKKILRRCAAIDLMQGKLHRWDKDGFFEVVPLGLASSVGVDRGDEEATNQFDEAIGILEQTGLVRITPESDADIWVHSLTLRFARNYFDPEDARYLAFRSHVEWSVCQEIMGMMGWIDYSGTFQKIRNTLPTLRKVSPDAALNAMSTLYAMADFSDEKDAEEIVDEAIEFASTHNEESCRTIQLMGLRIDKAYSAYKRGRLDEAEELYERIVADLKTTPANTAQLSDCLYYFGCLLLALGNDQRKTRALKLWEEAIEILLEELPELEQKKAPPFFMYQVKLRLLRLVQAKAEEFPEVTPANAEDGMAPSLLAELELQLGGHPMSWDRQFLHARGPLSIMMTARAIRRVPTK